MARQRLIDADVTGTVRGSLHIAAATSRLSGATIMEVYRTPEERFERLPGFGYQPRYRHVADLRLAHIDEGEGAPVVFLHGEPTWSFLWRNVIPPVRDAGYRCIAPDLVGFGRSDKPVDPSWYSYDRHVELVAALLEDLDLRGATLVVHDWGGPIGLRVAVQDPQRVGRIVAMDTGVFTGHQPMSQAWHRFADFVARTQDLPIGLLVRRGCATDPGDAVVAAYEAPFPEQRAKAGAKAFPALIPLTPAPGCGRGLSLGAWPAATTEHRRRWALSTGGQGARDRRDHRRMAPRRTGLTSGPPVTRSGPGRRDRSATGRTRSPRCPYRPQTNPCSALGPARPPRRRAPSPAQRQR